VEVAGLLSVLQYLIAVFFVLNGAYVQSVRRSNPAGLDSEGVKMQAANSPFVRTVVISWVFLMVE
jgi:hypothetical protein